MRWWSVAGVLPALFAAVLLSPARAQSPALGPDLPEPGAAITVTPAPLQAPLQIVPPPLATDLSIGWEVKNRFRLFRSEADFRRHVAALQLKSVLAAEQLMANETDGLGWAAAMLTRLCVDPAGDVPETCERDGARESYLAPADYRIGARLEGRAGEATCAWSFDDGQGPARTFTGPCTEEVTIRVAASRPTIVTVDVANAEGTRRATTEILVRDLLVAGLGDSIAAGEGNPDRPVALADDGFCFRRFLAGAASEYFRPGRAGFRGNKSCEVMPGPVAQLEWARLGARWVSQACHRSLYGYQVRTAIALAVSEPHIAVTFLPLACTGATIAAGLFDPARAREVNCGASRCPRSVPSQLTRLQQLLGLARRAQADRKLDLVLLTVGANDIDFSGLVADVMIEAPTERLLLRRGGALSTAFEAQDALDHRLPRDFARLRAALKGIVGDLSRVVFTSYGHPALNPDGGPCAGGQEGFDVHPAFGIDRDRLREVSDFVRAKFLPRLKDLALCEGGVICRDPNDRMTFVDAHQQAFAAHGLCTLSDLDPAFDKECFLPGGKSFEASPVEGAIAPLACGQPVKDFRPYAPRARWIRTANDSYFTAMTYPEGLPATMQPSDIHDAMWGVLSAVYGGAVHPTAEGHAAMADAALAAAREALGFGRIDTQVKVEPLPEPTSQ